MAADKKADLTISIDAHSTAHVLRQNKFLTENIDVD